jgi:hypothetical protein
VTARSRDALRGHAGEEPPDASVAGHDGEGGHVDERSQDECALVHARMRQRQRWRAHATAAE